MHELIVLLAFSLLLISCSKEQSEALSPTELIDLYEGWSSNEDGGSFGNHSEDYLEERELFLDSLQKRFSTDKTKDLSITDQASIDLLNLITAHELYELKFQSQLSPLNSEGGFLTDILYRTRSQRVETENEWEEYQIFLREIPEFFAERQKNMERGMEANKMMPHVVIDHCIEAADKVLRGKTDASFFLSPVAHNEQWSEDVKIILQEELLPAYRGVKEFLSTEYRSAAPAKIGLSEMTDGKEYYEQLVRFYSTFEINLRRSIRDWFGRSISDQKRDGSDYQGIGISRFLSRLPSISENFRSVLCQRLQRNYSSMRLGSRTRFRVNCHDILGSCRVYH